MLPFLMLNKRNKVISTAMPRRTETQDLTCCLNNNPVLDMTTSISLTRDGHIVTTRPPLKRIPPVTTGMRSWLLVLPWMPTVTSTPPLMNSAPPVTKTFLTGGDGEQGPRSPFSGGLEAYVALATGCCLRC